MTTTDPTITIAGLRARIDSLRFAVQHSNRTAAERMTMFVEASSNADRLTAERDALAAQLAEVRAELAAAPKVCAIHSYALEGPCMTCGAPWPGAEKALRQERIEGMEKMLRISAAVGCPNSVEEVVEAVAAIKSDLASERAHLAACQTRIAGLEQAADERSRTGQVSEPERSEWIGAAVAVADALGGSLGPVSGTSGTIDPREWIHFAAGLADRAKKLTARMAELEARPVLTHEILSAAIKKARKVPPYIARQAADEYMPHLGPVTLPAQDRAEELVSAWRGICTDSATCDLDPAERMRRALASLGAPATTPTAAPGPVAAVSVEELAKVYSKAYGEIGDVDDQDRIRAIGAVLARLSATTIAPVDPEAVARAYHDHKDAPAPEWDEVSVWRGRDADEKPYATSAMRATLIARGIPVTPEVGK